LIVAGTLLLWAGNNVEHQLSLIDAIFISTSAVCVTGLVVVDTGADLAGFSQFVVLLLMQLGGLGVMTATTALPLLWGGRIGLRQRFLFAGQMGVDTPSGAIRLLGRVLKMTLVIEAVAVIPLFFAFHADFRAPEALWYSIFHSVSAFCNAGFSLFPDSLSGYSATWIVPGVVMALVVVGGLGFLPLSETVNRVLYGSRFSVHSRLVFMSSAILVASGAAVFIVTETSLLAPFSPGLKIWNALFQSITTRTAGFSTIPASGITSAGLLFTMLLMIVGASPGSTGGGVKTTCFSVLLISSWREIRGGGDVVIWKRRIPGRTVRRSLALVVIYLLTIVAATMLMTLIEPFDLGDIAFEVVSALGTVGLSTGITPALSNAGKLVLVVLMFWGRVGLITFMYSLVDLSDKAGVSYTDTWVPIG